MITVQLLYSGGHVHSLKTFNASLVSDLIISKGRGDRLQVIYDEDGEREIGLIDLDHLQMAWEVNEE